MAKAKKKMTLEEQLKCNNVKIQELEQKKQEIENEILSLKEENETLDKDIKQLKFNEAEVLLAENGLQFDELIKAIKNGDLDISKIATQNKSEYDSEIKGKENINEVPVNEKEI